MIKNFSTRIDAEKTIGEITALLIKKGARSISTDFDADGRATALHFALMVYESLQSFSIPVNVEGVARVMLREEPWKPQRSLPKLAYEGKIRLQARATAWRILKDWLDAQMAVIEAGQAELAQVFLPYALEARSVATVWHLWSTAVQKQLASGSEA